jgi:hypothetical protein
MTARKTVKPKPRVRSRARRAPPNKKSPKPEFKIEQVYSCCGLDCQLAMICEKICGGKVTGVYLGKFHDYDASLLLEDGKRCVLSAGCRRFSTISDAQRHWRGSHNRYGAPRPHAGNLIAKAQRAANAVGWKWEAATLSPPKKKGRT